MLPFSVWIPQRAEPETKVSVQVVYLVLIPGNRNEEERNEPENRQNSIKDVFLSWLQLWAARLNPARSLCRAVQHPYPQRYASRQHCPVGLSDGGNVLGLQCPL